MQFTHNPFLYRVASRVVYRLNLLLREVHYPP